MDVQLIGQFLSFGRNLSDLQISVCPTGENSFSVYLCYSGDNSILTYNVQFKDEFKDTQSDVKRRKNSDATLNSSRNMWKLTFLKSHVLPFPVYFLVSIKDSTWAVSHDTHEELKLNVPEMPCNDEEIFPPAQPMDVDSVEFEESASSGKFKTNSVCCVSKFSGGIVVCREDIHENCWLVEIVRTHKKPMALFRIPFVNSPIPSSDSCNDSGFSHSFRKEACSTLKHVPTITCIEVENEFNQRNENVLKIGKFTALFGLFECGLLSNTVVLIGLPDGRILWQFLHFSDAFSSINEQTEFHLLCSIEQPVHHISTQPYNETGEICYIIVIGTYGKVVILSPEESSNPCKTEAISSNPFIVCMSHIPSPVDKVALCHQGLLHLSSDGHLWLSTFTREKMISSGTSQETDITLDFQQLSYYGIKHIMVLNNRKGIIMCVGSDGSLYIGNLFRMKAMDHGIAEEEMPLLLKSIYQYGNQLQELEVVAQKQRRLFSALAAAAKIKFQNLTDDEKMAIFCKITEISSDVKKFFISVEFQNLTNFNLDHELWTLSASVSSVQGENITMSQSAPVNQGCSCITIEIVPSSFMSPIFPLLVEGGLLLDIPTEWKSFGCFQGAVPNLPLYMKIQTVLVNELYILRENDPLKSCETVVDQFEQFGYKSVFTALQKIARTRSSYSHFQNELSVRTFNLPQEFSIPISASSVHSILKNSGVFSSVEDADLPEKLTQILVRRSNLTCPSSHSDFTCLDNPVSISVKRKENFTYITLCSRSFPLLVGFKMSVVSLLKEEKVSESTEKNIIISSKLNVALQALSIEISQLLCQDKSDVTQEDLDVYRKLREDISSNLHIF